MDINSASAIVTGGASGIGAAVARRLAAKGASVVVADLQTEKGGLPGDLGNGALITVHGSWNRQPPRPPSVAFSPWDSATNTLGAPRELVTGFQNEDGTRWGRSVTAVPGPDRSIYLTDDQAGLVYRLTPPA